MKTATLLIPHVAGKGRPRFNGKTGRVYTPDETKQAERVVLEAWDAAGQPRFFDAPLVANIRVHVPRPKSHWLKDGALSAAGLREPFCVRKPDLDNVEKLVFDALNKHAFYDDAQVIDCHTQRVWNSAPGQEPVTVLSLWVAA